MKKVVWISLASFPCGILLAGYVFVYLPDKKAQPRSFLDKPTRRSAEPLSPESPRPRPDLDFVKVSDKVGPAVVKIECEKVETPVQGGSACPEGPGDDFWDRFFGSPRQRPQRIQDQAVQGTGFFISADGYIVTNNHIVENATEDQGLHRPGRRIRGQGHRHRSPDRRRPDQGRGQEHPLRRARRFGPGQGRRMGPGHRQPPGHGAHRHGRHRQRQGPPARPGRQQLRGLHPDRRGHQPRQLRRPAGQHEGRGHRHQQQHPDPDRRQHRHRLRHPLEHGQEGRPPAQGEGQGRPRLAGRQHPARSRSTRTPASSSTSSRARAP